MLLLQLGFLGILGFRFPRAAGLALGAWMAVLVTGTGAEGVLVVGVLLLAGARDRIAGMAAGVMLLVALKQEVIAAVFPVAREVVPQVVVQGLVFAGGLAAGGIPRASRWLPWGILAGFLLNVLMLLPMGWDPPLERLRRAVRYDAVSLVYNGVLEDAERAAGEGRKEECYRLTAELVTAEPSRDEGAVALGVQRALNLGWYPQKAEGRSRCGTSEGNVLLQTAQYLEVRGRGGQAWRLLRKWPREGEVDWQMALLEASQSLPVRWKGGKPDRVVLLPQRLDWAFDTNAYRVTEFLLADPAKALVLDGEGTPYQGPPRLQVALDGEPPRPWTLDGPSRFRWEGPVSAGPHRLSIRFEEDRMGPDGDRNARVDVLAKEI